MATPCESPTIYLQDTCYSSCSSKVYFVLDLELHAVSPAKATCSYVKINSWYLLAKLFKIEDLKNKLIVM